jgi:hypothetical protein
MLQPEDWENSHIDYTATVWLAGGQLGKTYHVTNRIETAGGRINDYTFDIKVSAT